MDRDAVKVYIVNPSSAEAYWNDYKVLNIDLGTARTDEPIADKVVQLIVLDRSTNASLDIKLISTDRDLINIPSDLDVGGSISNAEPFSVYASNAAQSGEYVKLLVLRRV